MLRASSRNTVYPYELTGLLGEFVEHDLDDAGAGASGASGAEPALVPVERPKGHNTAAIVAGVVTTPTTLHPQGVTRVVLLGDPTKSLGALSEPECRRVIAALDLAERFDDPSVRKNVELDLALVATYDEQINALELYLTRTAKVDDPQAFHRLRSVPGIGKVLALILLYEIHDSDRFPEAGQFLSYARLVRCAHESAGKKQGTGGNKIGNAHLKWAFSEAACLFLRENEQARKWLARREKKHGKARALGALAARRGRLGGYRLPRGLAAGGFRARGRFRRGPGAQPGL